ncbi:valine--tRNA ligase [Phreatobacter sp. AB_2022a]|uniref:valine--tRNA ligase n=1 Tax=Phreatobacter sp. AB_2022a TaxID=3003134 RepID=UPI002286F6DB|nr:valine--tRNA ligase [Phreatobacter sp. AB_2022a]MCZ0737327.1 valine--tRNA ligase [Phreatobacter sp. AB_2022a]
MLEKTYTPKDIEARMSAVWEKAEAFRAGRPERVAAEPFCIVIPPPNVTGSLHMGHALNNTLQDVLCRYERMRGKDVLWQPGTDHAGIATQMVVERKLAAENRTDRRTMGREAFLKEVWAWKETSGGTITNQLRRLGASCDWSRERFTMDEGLSKAVVKVFVDLYRQGLIYKDKRLVNWDPKLLTAISDLEVVQTEMRGKLWYFDYPLAEDPAVKVTVATTRPETMLGDTAVAVHPDDERWQPYIGKHVRLPLVGRLIPIVADAYSDPEKGSGAVKITPAHDFNDFEVGKRHNLPQINIFDVEARLALAGNEDFLAGAEGADLEAVLALDGVDRFEARKRIVAMMEERGLLARIEDHLHMVPHGDRGGVPVEPFLTDQWYVDAKTLAEAPLKAVREGRTAFVPKNWEKTFFEWMENIQPWCVSRQLWWGHQIPAWYGPDGRVFVAPTAAEAEAEAAEHYGAPTALTRDEDVLDTWFSSALWPFSTLGWPDETPELKRYYQTDVLVTGFDIIFFWVARMMMMGLHFMQEEPFHTVYIHALVRDEKGAKMSKSKGNVIDPLDLIDQFGADALRFTLAAMAAQGRDIKLATSRVEGYRNFATKLWNAARFCEINECRRVAGFDPAAVRSTLARWIVGETAKAIGETEAAIGAYKFNEAAGAVYRFVWNVFCDWFLEFAKPVFTGADEEAKAEIRATAAWTLDQILKMLHPFMPFITEELWSVTGEAGPAREGVLALAAWPQLAGLENGEAEAEIGWLVDTVQAIRSVRAEMNVAPGAQVPLVLVGVSEATVARARRYGDLLNRLARLSEISTVAAAPKGSVQLVVRGETVALPLAGVIDVAAESQRLAKALKEAEGDIARCDAKLNNANFMARAAEEVIEEQREKREEAAERKAKVEAALARLKEVG